MDLKDFDKAIGTAVRQAVHNQLPPMAILGLLHQHAFDVSMIVREQSKPSIQVLPPGMAGKIINQNSKGN